MLTNLKKEIEKRLFDLEKEGRFKGNEKIIIDILPAEDGFGKKIVLEDGKKLINFASNSYLGLSNDKRLVDSEHDSSAKYGVGPGAVRFISGTQKPHIDLESKLAEFFNKEAAMIYSSAYGANCGIVTPLVNEETVIISDELNHNSIINAVRLAGLPRSKKKIYAHCDIKDLERCITESIDIAERLLIVSDGVFSMRGDYPPLHRMVEIADKYHSKFKDGIIIIIDDSHGIGALGETGRGVIEICQTDGIDIITGTLGKALGVDGGFVVTDAKIVEYLRETSPFYVYSNPISAGVASASLKALEILDSSEGKDLLKKLRENSEYFRKGIENSGLKTIKGSHPIIPVIIGDPKKAKEIVSKLYEKGIFVVALTFPVVPRGQDTIRVQISATHTKKDLDYALESFKKASREAGMFD